MSGHIKENRLSVMNQIWNRKDRPEKLEGKRRRVISRKYRRRAFPNENKLVRPETFLTNSGNNHLKSFAQRTKGTFLEHLFQIEVMVLGENTF